MMNAMSGRRLHSLTGVAPLGAFLVYHLWVNWPACNDREAWLVRRLLVGSVLESWIAALFAVCLAVHVALSVAFLRESDTAPLLGSPGLRRLQQITGGVALLFIVYHLYQVTAFRFGSEIIAGGAYDVLWSELGMPLRMFIYVVGVSAVFFHFAQGLCRAVVRWNLLSSKRGLTAARYLAGAIGFLLWGMSLQLISHFAIGEGLFG